MKMSLGILSFGLVAALGGVASAQIPVYRTAYAVTAPVVRAAPVVVQTAPVIVYQRPVYVASPPVYLAPPAAYYVPPPVVSFGFGGCHRGFGAFFGPSIGFNFSFGHGHHSRHGW